MTEPLRAATGPRRHVDPVSLTKWAQLNRPDAGSRTPSQHWDAMPRAVAQNPAAWGLDALDLAVWAHHRAWADRDTRISTRGSRAIADALGVPRDDVNASSRRLCDGGFLTDARRRGDDGKPLRGTRARWLVPLDAPSKPTPPTAPRKRRARPAPVTFSEHAHV